MNKTKLSLEYKLDSERRITDSVDKVHFREPVSVPFVLETNPFKLNQGYKSRAVIDLSKSNYFILDMNDRDEDDWTDFITAQFINYEGVQRFEILVISDIYRCDIDWDIPGLHPGQDVVFPFGEPPTDLMTRAGFPQQRIISFRQGLSVNGYNQWIGIITPWFSSAVMLNTEITPYSTPVDDNLRLHTCTTVVEINEELFDHDRVDPALSIAPPISSERLRDDGKFHFNLLRGYKYAVHCISNLGSLPSFSKFLTDDYAMDHIQKDFSVTSSDPRHFSLHELNFQWHIELIGSLTLSATFFKGGQTVQVSYTVPADYYQNVTEDKINQHITIPFNANKPFGSILISHIFVGSVITETGDLEDAVGTTFMKIAFSQSYTEDEKFLIPSVSIQAHQDVVIDPPRLVHLGDFCALDYINVNQA